MLPLFALIHVPLAPSAAVEVLRVDDYMFDWKDCRFEIAEVLEFNCVPEAPMAAVDVTRTADCTACCHVKRSETDNPFNMIDYPVRCCIVMFATVSPSNCVPSIYRLFVPFELMNRFYVWFPKLISN